MFLRKFTVSKNGYGIDFDKIKDPSKQQWLINSLKLMQIGFQTIEKPQTIIQYNKDLEKGNAEIEDGEFIKAIDLKEEAGKWQLYGVKSAKHSLKQAFEYIALDSQSNAQMIRDILIDATIDLSQIPEKYLLDKFKTENDGTRRALKNIIIAFLTAF